MSAMVLQDKRILIVEDEPILAFDLETIVCEAGAHVVGPALFVADALLLIRNNSISAAILDVRVGVEDVYPVARLLADRGIPFLFHTGHGCTAELNRLWPTALVLPKPATTSRLLSALLQLLQTEIE